jgi:hypothetical protein
VRWPGLGQPKRLNATRRALVWWFGPPQGAHQNATCSLDAGAALAYLEGLNASGGTKVTLNHLLAAAIARTLTQDVPDGALVRVAPNPPQAANWGLST